MINALYEPFPESIHADGQEYKILTDFRDWLRFSDMLHDTEISAADKAFVMGDWLMNPPEIITAEIVAALTAFLRADALNPDSPEPDEDEPDEPEPPHPPYFDFTYDAKWILGDFRRFYGIDLRRAKYLHWWEFRALLSALPDESMTMRRVAYRSADLNKIKNKAERARIAKIQREIAIPFEYDDEMIGAVLWDS